MKAALCLAQDESFSSVTRMLACSEALTDEGWGCTLLANRTQREKLPVTTATVLSTPDLAPLSSCPQPITTCDDLMAALGLCSETQVWREVECHCDLLDRLRPDAVVADLSPIAVLAAHHLHLPQVASLRWTYHPANPVNSQHSHPESAHVIAALGAVLRRLDIDSAPSSSAIMYSLPSGRFIPSIPPFEPGLRSDEGSWVGLLSSRELESSLRFAPAAQLTSRRLYVYLDPTSIAIRAQLNLLSSAFRDSEWHVVLALANACGTHDLPANLEPMQRPPGRAALDWCDVYVTHGGINSLLSALLVGRPVVCVPGDSEERGRNAAAMADLGWALTLGPDLPSAGALRQACDAATRLRGTAEGTGWQQQVRSSPGAVAVARQLGSILRRVR